MAAKKKPAKRKPAAIGKYADPNWESRASVALDGTTQFCIACDTLAGSHHTHSCGERPITAEERAVVEAAMRQEKAAQRAMSSLSHGIKLEYDDACSKTEAACRALRAERSGA